MYFRVSGETSTFEGFNGEATLWSAYNSTLAPSIQLDLYQVVCENIFVVVGKGTASPQIFACRVIL